ncbi:16S rRNA (cytosine(967)-C(5))-methyltransferase RsmB [Simplicispira psychrophila]|uniref:16S rRNA (cytosine(967)-C(5))-methyltransferase RsmB n=1 Tax=Simplicispira psychrophila TaxID=80882 RepID=UPI00068AB887
MTPSSGTGLGTGAGAGMHSIALASQLQQVAGALQDILGGRSGSAVLDDVPAPLRPGVQALLFQVLRKLGWAQAIRRQLAPRTPRPPVDALLCTALALLADAEHLPYEPFTLVNQTIEAAKQSSAVRAQAPFINACLRRFLRERAPLQQAIANDLQAQWNHPRWWVQRLQKDHPQHWQQILEANNLQAPMVLRINKQKGTSAQYQKALAAIDIEASLVGESGLVLRRGVPVQALPGFAEGMVSVQDAAAQLAAPLLLSGLELGQDPHQPLRVLDACAAPGGKTAHLLEWMGPEAAVQVTALDIDPLRCARIDDTLQRLGLQRPEQVQVLAADAGRPQDWWPQRCGGQLFDAILLDAPCTASGIVRRHPDVRWLRRETDIAQLAQTQARLLATLWPLLRPGGRLLYCTCSVFLAEGEQQVKAFLAHHTDAGLLPSPGHLWPGKSGKPGTVPDNLSGEHDGFFYALLQKTAP